MSGTLEPKPDTTATPVEARLALCLLLGLFFKSGLQQLLPVFRHSLTETDRLRNPEVNSRLELGKTDERRSAAAVPGDRDVPRGLLVQHDSCLCLFMVRYTFKSQLASTAHPREDGPIRLMSGGGGGRGGMGGRGSPENRK